MGDFLISIREPTTLLENSYRFKQRGREEISSNEPPSMLEKESIDKQKGEDEN